MLNAMEVGSPVHEDHSALYLKRANRALTLGELQPALVATYFLDVANGQALALLKGSDETTSFK